MKKALFLPLLFISLPVFANQDEMQFDVFATCRVGDQAPLTLPVMTFDENKRGRCRILASEQQKRPILIEVKCVMEGERIRYVLGVEIAKSVKDQTDKVSTGGTTYYDDPISVRFSSEGQPLDIQVVIRNPKRRSEYEGEVVEELKEVQQGAATKP